MAIQPVALPVPAVSNPAGAAARVPTGDSPPFADVVSRFIGDANAQQLQLDQVTERFATGQTDNVHEVVVAAAKADLSFRLVLEIRNRLIESYQEIMRMQM
jgi:flagellar hook-basal body complex protein FliE